jgi:hypothetical protein
MVAKEHLDRLRDPTYVYPALSLSSQANRLAAVSCLAFLVSNGAREALGRLAIDDPHGAVRSEAEWALGFVGMALGESSATENDGEACEGDVALAASRRAEERHWWGA